MNYFLSFNKIEDDNVDFISANFAAISCASFYSLFYLTACLSLSFSLSLTQQ
jgi:hypothetical protein